MRGSARLLVVLLAASVLVLVSGECSAIPIGLKSGGYDPDLARTRAQEPLAYGAAEIGPTDFFIVQFDCPITPEMRASLVARGARILAYLPTYAFIVKMAGAECQQLLDDDVLHHVEVFQPYYKVSPELRSHLEAAGGKPAGKDPVELTVLVLAGEDCDAVSKMIAGAGFSVRERAISVRPSGGRIRLSVALSDMGQLLVFAARIKSVEWIEEWVPPQLHNHEATWIVQSYQEDYTPLWDHGVDGSGQLVALGDCGVDADMCYFYDSEEGLPDDSINHDQRKIVYYYDMVGNGDWDGHDHGTHVACTIAGDNSADLNQPDYDDGIAYNAKLVVLDVGDGASLAGLPTDLYDYFIFAYDAGARVQANCWGSPTSGGYISYSRDCDEFMWEHPDFLAVFSVGNEGDTCAGSTYAPATAKNVLSSGATQNHYPPTYSPEDIYYASGLGPCADGRMKPTAVAPGQYLVSADNDCNISSYNCSTRMLAGTSMACATHTAAAVLVRQYFVDGYFPSGEANPEHSLMPSAALLKAVIVNSGRSMTGNSGGAIPNNTQGWGRTTLDDTLYFSGDDRLLWVEDEKEGLETGQYCEYNVPIWGDYLEVTLVWTDHPSGACADPALVNDLDLEVAFRGTTYLGNVYSCGQSTTGGSADRLNPVECVELNAPEPGNCTITVIAHNVPEGPQPFALVLSSTSEESDERENWPMFRQDAAHAGRTQTCAFESSPTIKWSYSVPAYSDSSPVEGTDGTIYFMGDDGNLLAFEPDGSLKWSYDVGSTSNSSPAVAPAGLVVVGDSGGYVTAVTPGGALEWECYVGNAVYYGITIDDAGNSCFTTMSNHVLLLSPTGSTISTFLVNGLPQSPAMVGASAFVGTTTGKLYELNMTTGSGYLVASGLGDISNSAAVDGDGSIYVGNAAGMLCKVEPSGTILWSYSAGDRIASSVAIATDGTVMFGCDANKVIALESGGTLKWSYDTGDSVSSSPAMDGNQSIVVGCRNGEVLRLDRDGHLDWSLNIGGDIVSSPAITQSGEVVISNGNMLYCIARENAAPMLSADGLSPASGTVDTEFCFYVHYTDPDGDPAEGVYVNVSGTDYRMMLDNGYAHDGHYSVWTTLPGGDHQIYYHAEDGFGGSDRVPDAGTKQGPVVNHDPELTNGTVTPTAGSEIAVYEYSAHYYDFEGQPPAQALVIIDSETPETMTLKSGDAADGDYSFSISLSQGSHTYRFHFEDDEGRPVDAPSSGNYDGPAVGDCYEPDDSCEDAKPISNDGAPQFRTLMPGDDVDFVVFEAPAGAHYVAQTRGNLDTVMCIWADDCTTSIAYDYNSGDGDNALIDWTCETAGVYHISVEGWNCLVMGDYELELLLDNSLPELSAPSVDPKYGEPGGRFLYSIDYYDADGDAPDTILVYVDGYAKVMGLTYGDPADGTYEYIQLSLDAGPHSYWFYAIDEQGGETRLPAGHFKGPFFVDDFESDNACRSASSVAVGASYYHTFWPPSDVDWIEFDAVAGEHYTIRAFSLSSNCDTVVHLYEDDCTTLIESDDDGGSGKGSQMNWQCPSSGTYFVKVQEKFGETGEYRLLVALRGEETHWTSFHHDNRNTGRTHIRGPVAPELKWSYRTGLGIYESSASIDANGRAYIGSSDSHVYAIDSDGSVAWSFDLQGYSDSAPAIDPDGNVYADAWNPTPGGHLYKLNSAGSPIWSYYTRSGDCSPVVDEEGTVYVASILDEFLAIASDGALKWSCKTSESNYSHMCLDGQGHVYGGGWDKRVHCLDTQDGHEHWFYETGGQIEGGIALDSRGRVLFGSSDHNLYCVDSSGSLVWSYPTADWLHTTPAIGLDDSSYFGSEDGVFYALDADGNLLWSYTVGSLLMSAPVIDGVGNLYFGSYDGKIYGLSPGGDLLWSYLTRREIRCSPAIGPDGRIVFGSSDYKVYCLGDHENECPTLSNEALNPEMGQSSDTFTYALDCLDPDSDDISASTILIDGTPHEMELSVGTPTDGRYVYTTGALTPGTHDYYFLFEDSDGCEARHPTSGTLSGPIVDDTRPWSDCTSPTITTSATIAVAFAAGDTGGSGIYNTKLYYRWGQAGDWTYYDYLEGSEGTFDFAASQGEGTYYFQTLAQDRVGNLELGPIEDGDDSTVYDLTAPSSSCTSPQFANSSPVVVSFTASDALSGVGEVRLWFSFNGGGWTDSGLTETGTSGSFDFEPVSGDGTYEFHSIATDLAGNTEAPPGAADTATRSDTAAPVSSCTSPQFANSSPIVVSFTASDTFTGVAEVALWFSFNGGGWTDSGLTETGTSGSFDFEPVSGDGTYEFHSIATDLAGNTEAPPGSADSATRCDTTTPESSCTSPQFANSSPIVVSFAASDTFTGVAEVALWFSFNGGAWTDSGLTETGTSGSFDFEPASGDGTYEFYTIACDLAGNCERASGSADAATLYDTTAPESSCTSAEYANSSPIVVSFTASDSPSGVEQVGLWFSFDGGAWEDSDLTQTGASGSFDFEPTSGDGAYQFYTISTDEAGNVEPAPLQSDASTSYDTTPPDSTATAPALTDSIPFDVGFTASDTTSGVDETDLWYQFEGGTWQALGAPQTGTSGSFQFNAPDAEGTYEFYTVSKDKAGNVEPAPSLADATTVYRLPRPDISLSDDELDFGEVPVAGKRLGPLNGEPQTVTVSNAGDADLVIDSISTTSQAFGASFVGSLPMTLAPDGTLEIDVSFTPATVGLHDEELLVSSNDPNTPTSHVRLLGEGVAGGGVTVDVSTSSSAYQFGDTVSIDVSLQNTGGPTAADIYLVLTYDLGGPEERSWSASLLTTWTEGISPVVADVEIEAGLELNMQWWSSSMPSEMPMIARSGTYTLRMGAVEPGTLNLVSNYAVHDFTLNGAPFVDVSTDRDTYSLTADRVTVHLDVALPSYSMTVDYYLVVLDPSGVFWTPTGLGEDVAWVEGAYPLIASAATPPDWVFGLDAVIVNLPSTAPFNASGQFLLLTAFVEPGTLTPFSDIGSATFRLQ